jgi:hypothetical protein
VPPPSDEVAPARRPRRAKALKIATPIFLVLTLVFGPYALGIPLLVLVPIDAVLLANLFVNRRDSFGIVFASLAGLGLLIGTIWFGGRFDKSTIEAMISTTLSLASLAALLWLHATYASGAPTWWARMSTWLVSERAPRA